MGMNPTRRRTHRRRPAATPNPRRRRRSPASGRTAYTYNPQTRSRMYYKPRRRRNPTTLRKKEFQEGLESGIATGLGLVAARTLSNMLLPGRTGYVKAGADAGIAAAAALALNAAKVSPRLVAALLSGGIASATVRLIDQLSGGKFGITVAGNYYEVSGADVQQMSTLLGNQYRALPASVGSYELTGVEDNVPISGPYETLYRAPYGG